MSSFQPNNHSSIAHGNEKPQTGNDNSSTRAMQDELQTFLNELKKTDSQNVSTNGAGDVGVTNIDEL